MCTKGELMAEVKIIDNTDEVAVLMENAILDGLKLCGELAESHAIVNVPVDTGALKQSITHKVVEDEVFIGTNLEYAPYVELGTGIYASEGGGRRTPWSYVAGKGSKYYEGGKVHITQGQKPTHFLKRAVTEHQNEYMEVMKRCIQSTLSKFEK